MKLIIDNRLTLLDFPSDITGWFTEQLTFHNPKFDEAVEHNRYIGNLEPHIQLSKSLPNGIIIPRGFLQIVEDSLIGQGLGITIVDNRILTSPISVQSAIELRGYQQEAKLDLLSHPNGMLVAPAGSGKTVMGLDVFASVRQKMLWLTHTNRLSNQVIERIVGSADQPALFPDISADEIGFIGAGKFDIGKQITIGMIPTLVRREDQLLELGKEFGLVIVDECLVAGSHILMLDGSLKDIKDIKNGDVTTFGKVTHKFCRHTKKLIQLQGGFGHLKGTPTHRLPYIPYKPYSKLTRHRRSNYFKRLSEEAVIFGEMGNINKKDFLLVTESFCHTARYKIGRRKSRLLALIACDGHISKHLYCIQIGITKDKGWFLKEMISDTSYVDCPDIRTSNCTRGDLIIRCYSKEIISYLNQFIPAGKKSRIVEVPRMMMYADMDDIANFLQIVFDTEGSVTDQVTLTMASHRFIRGVAYLLRKFGIISRIIPIKLKNMLRLSMCGYDVFLFWKKIGFSIERKQIALENLMRETSKSRRTIQYKGVVYRCMPVVSKKIINSSAKVYDFTTEDHLFTTDGILSSNCHHVPASTFLQVLNYFSSYYLYGMTATPYRRDKLEKVMSATIGISNAVVKRKEVKAKGGIITPTVYKRTVPCAKWDNNDFHYILREIIPANAVRIEMIVADVVREAKAGNYCIVISTRKSYCETLNDEISHHWAKTSIATGDYSRKHNDEQVARLENGEITVLITTFELLGEGFDVKKLNRGFIVLPFRERARVEQTVGRIQRTCEGKKDAILYDYVDEDIGILKNQFIHRAMTYKLLGMRIINV